MSGLKPVAQRTPAATENPTTASFHWTNGRRPAAGLNRLNGLHHSILRAAANFVPSRFSDWNDQEISQVCLEGQTGLGRYEMRPD
jgi:hypothetical protein